MQLGTDNAIDIDPELTKYEKQIDQALKKLALSADMRVFLGSVPLATQDEQTPPDPPLSDEIKASLGFLQDQDSRFADRYFV